MHHFLMRKAGLNAQVMKSISLLNNACAMYCDLTMLILIVYINTALYAHIHIVLSITILYFCFDTGALQWE